MGRPETVAVQALSSFRVTTVPLDSVTVMNDGRMPSTLFSSCHTFLTVTCVVSGVWTLVSVVTPFSVTWAEV